MKPEYFKNGAFRDCYVVINFGNVVMYLYFIYLRIQWVYKSTQHLKNSDLFCIVMPRAVYIFVSLKSIEGCNNGDEG